MIALLIMLTLLVVLRWTHLAESWFFYFPSREVFATPPTYQDITFQTADGRTLHAWFMPAPGASASNPGPAVLHVHGNAGNIASHAGFSDYLPRHGVSVLIFDYRGYGRSDSGWRNRKTLMRDSLAAFEALLSRPEVDPERVGVLGVSLGGVFAIELAARSPQIRAIATISAFESWSRIARDHAWWVGAALIPSGLDPRGAIPRLSGRNWLIVHGLDDKIVPHRHALSLEAAANEASVLVRRHSVPRANHNDIIDLDPAVAIDIAAFFRTKLAE